MKILGLRFKNLNSLYGEWSIDFTDEEYISNGIFAITGQTGAGKSTILDAICLALYGSTPRLNLITKSSNEIMSRQTGDCYAEVIFKVNDGIFRCHWSQHRARKKADGKLGDSVHEISDVNTGKVLESKKKDVARAVIEKTGMDLDRFTRSILLAQGGFTAFLKATADERAPILEQITGTEIYSTISIKIHEKQKSEQEKLTILAAETKGITFLTSEEEVALNQDLEGKITLESKVSAHHNELNRMINWLTGIDSLRNESKILKTDYEKVKTDIEIFKPNKNRLLLANKASELDGIYTELTTLRQLQDHDTKFLNNNLTFIPKLKSTVKEKTTKLEVNEQKLTKLQEEYKLELGLINRVQELDIKIDQNVSSLKITNNELKEIVDRVNLNRENVKNISLKKVGLQKEFEDINSFLEKFDYSILNQKLGGIKLLSDGITNIKTDLINKELVSNKLNISNGQINSKFQTEMVILKGLESQKEEYILAIKDQKKSMEDLLNGKLLREYQNELKSLREKRLLLAKISSLEVARDQLKDGLECPLCGSKEHPFAVGNIPEVSSVDGEIKSIELLIYNHEEFDTKLKDLEVKLTGITNKITDAEKNLIKTKSEQNEIENNLKREQLELSELKSRFNSSFEALGIELKPYDIELKEVDDTTATVLDLSQRVFKWQTSKEKFDSFTSKTLELNSKIDQLEAVFKTEETSRLKKEQSLEIVKIELKDNQNNRRELYEDKVPAREQSQFETLITQAESNIKTSRDSKVLESNKLLELDTQNRSLNNQISDREDALREKELVFLEEYKSRDFLIELDFVNVRLSSQEREHLLSKDRQLENLFNTTSTRIKDREETLQKELKRELTTLSMLELQTELIVNSTDVKKLGGEIGAIKERLDNNALAIKRLDQKREFIEQQQLIVEKWLKLHSLIGSADGKKFRNFAQGLTFELMVSHANKQLISMTDRYILVRDKEKPLELNVIDNYQAGEERSTKNLSGGESFIISLSLALGLSNMASNRVKVDSLFLDEGFGTLDEEALETALETLSGLHQTGKLIGIISHIPALKDRISTQIQVSKGSGGRGTISGPGCKRVE